MEELHEYEFADLWSQFARLKIAANAVYVEEALELHTDFVMHQIGELLEIQSGSFEVLVVFDEADVYVSRHVLNVFLPPLNYELDEIRLFHHVVWKLSEIVVLVEDQRSQDCYLIGIIHVRRLLGPRLGEFVEEVIVVDCGIYSVIWHLLELSVSISR